MMVTPSCDTPIMTTQLRLLAGGELPQRAPRARVRRTDSPARPTTSPNVRLNAQTRQIGQSGVAEARRRLAEIHATADRVQQLVKAS